MKFSKKAVVWNIIDCCNYRCDYCCIAKDLSTRKSDSKNSRENIDKILSFLSRLEGSWEIRLIGGEPTIHPNFLEICRKIIDKGHKLSITTNFSLSCDQIDKLIYICKDKLVSFIASYHIKFANKAEFLRKAEYFNSKKNKNTFFIVVSVLKENNLLHLKEFEKDLEKRKVLFRYQILQKGRKFERYKKETEEYIKDKLIYNSERIRSKSFFGNLCYSGRRFFYVLSDGSAYRCFNIQPGWYLGNIIKGTFKMNKKAEPCLAHRCMCNVILNMGLVCYNKRARLRYLINYGVSKMISDKDIRSRILNKIHLKKSIEIE